MRVEFLVLLRHVSAPGSVLVVSPLRLVETRLLPAVEALPLELPQVLEVPDNILSSLAPPLTLALLKIPLTTRASSHRLKPAFDSVLRFSDLHGLLHEKMHYLLLLLHHLVLRLQNVPQSPRVILGGQLGRDILPISLAPSPENILDLD